MQATAVAINDNSNNQSPKGQLSPRMVTGNSTLVTHGGKPNNRTRNHRKGRSVSVMNKDLPEDPMAQNKQPGTKTPLKAHHGSIGFGSPRVKKNQKNILNPVITTKPR